MNSFWPVREHIPLEQGLRRYHTTDYRRKFLSVREHIPLEQGLRPEILFCYPALDSVREHIPLEQGLRPILAHTCALNGFVREHIPLEQGLRHNALKFYALFDGWSESIFH